MNAETKHSPLLAKLANNRRALSIGLVAAGILFTVLAIWWMIWGWPASSSSTESRTEISKAENKLLPSKNPDESSLPAHSRDYFPAGIWAGLVAAAFFGGAGWISTQPPSANPQATLRAELLFVGGIIGFLSVLLGILFAWSWQESLFDWINEGKTKEARWVLMAGSIFLAGLAVMFFSMQLAKAEERHNPTLRRILYGFNTLLVGLLLLLLLAGINVVSFLKIPSSLVTTDAAFASLSEPSQKVLRALDKPVHAYLIMPENHEERKQTSGGEFGYPNLYTDCRALLSQCASLSPNFKATYLSPKLERGKIGALMDRLKLGEKERDQVGILLTAGENEEATSFLSSEALIDLAQSGRLVQFLFQGENKLINEVIYLTNSRENDVVYITQDHGERTLEPKGRTPYSMSGAINFLRDKKVRVEVLKFKDDAPAVIPDDAAAVLVVGPTQTILESSPTYKAIKEYLKPTTARKPGKLIAYLPAVRGLDNKVAPTGLEPLLREFGVDLSPDRRWTCMPQQFRPIANFGFFPPDVVPGGRVESGLSLDRTMQSSLLFKNARPIHLPPNGTVAPFNVIPLLISPDFPPSLRAGYWEEEDFSAPFAKVAELIRTDAEVRTQKRFGHGPLVLTTAVTEGNDPNNPEKAAPRMILFSSDMPIQDQPEIPLIPDSNRFQVLSDALDWLRERDSNLGIPPKKEAIYQITNPSSGRSLLVLMGTIMAAIVGLGVAVWLSRRR
jgi:hypothetical protein